MANSEDWRTRFLLALRQSPSVSLACEAAGIARQTAYTARKDDPEFAAQWQDAIEHAIDALEHEVFKRAKATSDLLAIFMLKAHRPHIYRETARMEVTGADGGPIELLAAVAVDARNRLAAQLALPPADDPGTESIDVAGVAGLVGAPAGDAPGEP